MREIGRKEFLGWGALGIGMLTLGIPYDRVYILWGDGIHDDTEALNAWIRDENVYWRGNDKRVEDYIGGKVFKLSDSLLMPPTAKHPKIISYCTFLSNDIPEGKVCLHYL